MNTVASRVAQIGNLPYRRMAFGRAPKVREVPASAEPGGLPIRDTADCQSALPSRALTSELLILPDGTVLAHNLTPAMAALLAELNPNDAPMQQRAAAAVTAAAPVGPPLDPP